MILAFFDTKEEVDIVLAGYVSEIIEDLLSNEYDIVSDYLFGNLTFIDQFIRHSYDYSVCKKILQSLLFQKDTGLSYGMEEDKKKEEKEFDRRILIAFDRLFLKLNTSKDNEVCSNILNLIKEAIDLEENDKEKISFLQTTLYSESSLNALFSYLFNMSSFQKGKQNFNLCLLALNKLVAFYPKLNEEGENKEEKDEKSWLAQNFIDKIEFFKETLENQKTVRLLDTNGENKRLLSSSRIHVIKLVIAALKLNNQPINITLSLSQIFKTITVGLKESCP